MPKSKKKKHKKVQKRTVVNELESFPFEHIVPTNDVDQFAFIEPPTIKKTHNIAGLWLVVGKIITEGPLGRAQWKQAPWLVFAQKEKLNIPIMSFATREEAESFALGANKELLDKGII
ncbi:hypothetical protein WD019_04555 [Fictibacillus sp. Mic-4]|uniref:hypothetical protein n=1 Tax=Fictibacillus sp. Mic-4 TaxID=3132826 RepID=UPI003CF6D205